MEIFSWTLLQSAFSGFSLVFGDHKPRKFVAITDLADSPTGDVGQECRDVCILSLPHNGRTGINYLKASRKTYKVHFYLHPNLKSASKLQCSKSEPIQSPASQRSVERLDHAFLKKKLQLIFFFRK